jgi:Bax protein
MQTPDQQRRAVFLYALLMVALFGSAFYIRHPQPPPDRFQPQVAQPAALVPAVSTLPDFAAIPDVEEKKQTFFDFLQPFVDARNAEIQRQRQRLLRLVEKIANGSDLDYTEWGFLRTLSVEYEVPADDLQNPAFLQLLLRRVDVIPPSLVLAQAANESAWGTSRFAQEGYNFFGQWCYSEGCGLVPVNRRPSDNHEVKSFSSIEEAVHAYFMNLNTFPSYQYLRLIRQDLRQNELPIDGISLSEGLQSYSERGDAYIDELRSMIYFNNLLHRDQIVIQ